MNLEKKKMNKTLNRYVFSYLLRIFHTITDFKRRRPYSFYMLLFGNYISFFLIFYKIISYLNKPHAKLATIQRYNVRKQKKKKKKIFPQLKKKKKERKNK